MCLSYVKKIKANKYGYKWFRTDLDNGNIRTPVERFECKIGQWLKAEPKTLFAMSTFNNSATPYQSGFHIYNKLKEAKYSWINESGQQRKLYRVLYRNYITGLGDGAYGGEKTEQIVAQKMKIINEVKLHKEK